MANTHKSLQALFGAIAQSIREKSGHTAALIADAFPEAIQGLPTQKPEQIIALPLAMSEGDQVVLPESGKALAAVTIQKPETLQAQNIKKGVEIGGILGSLEGSAAEHFTEYRAYTAEGEPTEVLCKGVQLRPRLFQEMPQLETVLCEGCSGTNLDSCFANCPVLVTPPVIPDTVQQMADCFNGCSSLTTAPVLPAGLKNASGAFGETALTVFPPLPDGIESISAFVRNCNAITEIPPLPNGITEMDGAFYGLTKLVNPVAFPPAVVNIGECYGGCTGLKTAPAIPSSVRYMRGVFAGCTGLTTAPVIPPNIEDMSEAFMNCTALTGDIYFDGDSVGYSMDIFAGTALPKTVHVYRYTVDGKETNIWSSFLNSWSGIQGKNGCTVVERTR